MDLTQRYVDFIKTEQLFHKSHNLLLAVSGGVDSVVLAHITQKAGFTFGIAHCNFQLRGTESERDEQSVMELAKQLRVPLYIKRFNTAAYANKHGVSIQVAARELRYQWFNEILESQHTPYIYPSVEVLSYQFIATAHHKDDNIETVLMNFCKGTGLRGLRGILPKQEKLVRPLLFASKEDLLDYAKEHQLNWAEDSSNEQNKYTRNYFRSVVIPAIEIAFGQAEENMGNSIMYMREAYDLYQQAIEGHKKKLLEVKDNETHIAVLKLLKPKPLHTVLYEIIKEYGFSSAQVGEVEKLLNSESGRLVQSATHRILRNRAWLILSPRIAEAKKLVVVEKEDSEKQFDNKLLRLQWIKEAQNLDISPDNSIATIDAQEVRFPLIIRKWAQGDYFYPLGMKKKKKLARFFIDQKLSINEKEKVWVVESHKKIIWVIGYRIDDRYKVTPATREVLILSITSL